MKPSTLAFALAIATQAACEMTKEEERQIISACSPLYEKIMRRPESEQPFFIDSLRSCNPSLRRDDQDQSHDQVLGLQCAEVSWH